MRHFERFSDEDKRRKLTERGRVTYSSFSDFYNAIIEKDPRVTETLKRWEFIKSNTLLRYRDTATYIQIDLNKGRSFYVSMTGAFISIEGRDIKRIYTDNDVIGIETDDVGLMTFGDC